MTAESETIRSKKPEVINTFREVLREIVQTPGERTEIVNLYRDFWAGGMRTVSMHTGVVVGEDNIKEALRQLISENFSDQETQETLEQSFKKKAVLVKEKGDLKTLGLEWGFGHDNVVLGLESTKKQGIEMVRSWYLRNTLKKPGLFSSLKK